MSFLAERPSIANPYGRAMVNEGVEVVVIIKAPQKRRRRGLATATCSAFFWLDLDWLFAGYWMGFIVLDIGWLCI